MKAESKGYLFMLLVVLSGRLFFVFHEAVTSREIHNQQEILAEEQAFQQTKQDLYIQSEQKQQQEQFSGVNFNEVQEETVIEKTQSDIQKNLQIDTEKLYETELEAIFSQQNAVSTLEDISILKDIYKQNPNDAVLLVLIDKLVQDYQFEEAYYYANQMIQEAGYQSIDAHSYLNIWLNSSQLSAMQPNSIQKFQTLVDEYRTRGLLTTDDYRFYQSLVAFWNQDYNTAASLLKQLTTPRYSGYFQNFVDIQNQVSQQKDIPAYYQDALMALQLLKKGYFNHANKVSLAVLQQDENYILPYQILAYSHFLTNNWEDAIDYFLKLTELNPSKSDIYKFYIGASYYRLNDYELSVLYLSQVEESFYKTKSLLESDVYRYLLLNYTTASDEANMIRTWQKMLGIDDLDKSDFYNYFYTVLFKPVLEGQDNTLYKKNPNLANEFVSACYDSLPEDQQEVCLFGHAGLDYLNNYTSKSKQKLLYIAQSYPQSYIFHILGDIYKREDDLETAKQYYIQAVSIEDVVSQQVILKNKISETLDEIGN